VNEEVMEVRKAYVLTDKKCIHLKAKKDMVDHYKIERKAGEEWLIGVHDAAVHILDVNEELVADVKITSLSIR
jgi:major vault protein